MKCRAVRFFAVLFLIVGAAEGLRGVPVSKRDAAVGLGKLVPLHQVFAEIESLIKGGRLPEAYPLFERALARMAQGEPLPEGVIREKLLLLAATAALRTGNVVQAATWAESARGGADAGRAAETQRDATWILALARASQGQFKEAVGLFGALTSATAYHDRAWLYRAMAAQQDGQAEVAKEAYHRHLALAPKDEAWADAALAVIALHLDASQIDEAQRGLRLLREGAAPVDNQVGLTLLSLRLGDACLAAGDPLAAGMAYRTLLPLAELQRVQKERDQALHERWERAKSRSPERPAEADAARQLEDRKQRIRSAVTELEKITDYDARILSRLGSAFQQRGKAWEAALIYERLTTRYPQAPDIEQAYAGLILAYAESGRIEKAVLAAKRIPRTNDPTAALAPALTQAAIKAQEKKSTASSLELVDLALQHSPSVELRETLLLLQANAFFAQGSYGDVRSTAENYLQLYPQGRYAEDATYLKVMAGLLLGPATRSLEEIQDYLARFPEGRFVADARYRWAAAEFSVKDYAKARERTELWIATFPADHPQRGEVFSLQGDILAAAGETESAIASFENALLCPLADDGLGHVLDELTRLQMERKEFAAASERWEQFAEKNPQHPFAVNAAYWIGRICLREGEPEAGLAKMASIAKRSVADPRRDAVERMLLELAKVMVSIQAREKRESKGTGGAGRQPLSEEDAWKRRVSELLLPGVLANAPTAQARALFVEAEVASLLKKPDHRDRCFAKLAEVFPPAVLPAGLLGRVGDFLTQQGQAGRAEGFYRELVEREPRSLFADFGYVGLGEGAWARGEYETALALFDAAIDKAGARFKLKEATVGRARSLLALERWDEAQRVFEQIASNRTWRGEATALSVFALGQICEQRGGPDSLAQAHAHFQRVYVGYRRFVPWVVRAYLQSAMILEKLGKRNEAVATYQELLRDERLVTLPEAQEARKALLRLESMSTGEQQTTTG